MQIRILRINSAGYPIEWVSWQQAACLHARELVSWTYGEEVMEVHAGGNHLILKCLGETLAAVGNNRYGQLGTVF